MNFAASGVKTVKSLFFLGAFSSFVAEAKTTFPPAAACHWPSSRWGLEEMTWPTLEAPPPKQALQRSGGLTGFRSQGTHGGWGYSWVSGTRWLELPSEEGSSE